MVKSVFRVLDKYKHLVKGAALEIGSDRYEGSTAYFNEVCKTVGVTFFSVDVEPGANQRARDVVGDRAYLMTGERFIQEVVPTLNIKFSFVCLDNFDFDINRALEHYEPMKKTYSDLGLSLNNENSKKAHLDQTILIYPFLEENAIVAFDDTWQKLDGTFEGKGGTAIPWLIDKGFIILEQDRIDDVVSGGYVVLTNRVIPLKIRVLACCKNEEKMLPFFLQYYSSIADEIILYDGGSTDKSVDIIASYPKAVLKSSGQNDKLDDRFLLDIRNEGWKDGRENWDWQIVVDVDEFVYHPRLLEKLREYKIRGITVPRTTGYEMMSFTFPQYNLNSNIVDQIRTGKQSEWLSKYAIFNPKEVDINYLIGCHANYSDTLKQVPTGNVVWGDAELMVWHYKWVSYDFFVNKNRYISNRLSDYNKSVNAGYHTSMWSVMQEEEFNATVASALPVGNLKLTVTDCKPLPYADNTITQIDVQNALEQVGYIDGHKAIAEWKRVLCNGGKLTISTVDFAKLCDKFAKSDDWTRSKMYESFFGAPWLGKFVQFLYTQNQLQYTLVSHDFRSIVRKESGEEELVMECFK